MKHLQTPFFWTSCLLFLMGLLIFMLSPFALGASRACERRAFSNQGQYGGSAYQQRQSLERKRWRRGKKYYRKSRRRHIKELSRKGPSSDQQDKLVISPALPLEERIGYTFQNFHLKRQALTRHSWHNGGREGERLEFLGDAVFNMLMLDILMARYPRIDQRDLHLGWEWLVNQWTQAQIANFFRLRGDITFSHNHVQNAQISSAKALSDILETLTGAVYMDGGWTAGKQLIARFLDSTVKWEDYKGVLVREMANRFNTVPEYEVLETKIYKGRKNSVKKRFLSFYQDRSLTAGWTYSFVAKIKISGRVLGKGRGNDPEQAIQNASMDSLKKMKFAFYGLSPTTLDPMATMPVPTIKELVKLPEQEYTFYYKKLKFLGHTVFNMATADLLMNRYPAKQEGGLTQSRRDLVDFINYHLSDKYLESKIQAGLHDSLPLENLFSGLQFF